MTINFSNKTFYFPALYYKNVTLIQEIYNLVIFLYTFPCRKTRFTTIFQ